MVVSLAVMVMGIVTYVVGYNRYLEKRHDRMMAEYRQYLNAKYR